MNRQKQDVGISVLGVTIDDLCKWEKLERVDYIKIDVQGTESKVIAGAIDCIKNFRPIIQAEVEVKKVSFGLTGYRIFQASASPNMTYIPQENAPGIAAAIKLNWDEK
jgi:hypothetical protein